MFFWISFGVLNGLICIMAMDMSVPHYQKADSQRLFDQFAYCSLAWPYLYAKAVVFSFVFMLKLPGYLYRKLSFKGEAKLPALLPERQTAGASLMQMITLIGEPVNQTSLRR